MKLRIWLPSLLITAAMAQGCVSSKKYKELQATYDRLQKDTEGLNYKFLTSEKNLAVANGRITSLDQAIASEKANARQLQEALNKCLNSSSQGNVNISKLVDEINSSNKYIQQLVNAKNKSDSLNMVLTNNLTRSLSQSEMKDVDVKVLKGVVYVSLSDNMLYKSGSYEISDKAGETLSKISKIIKDYANYDVLIEGNTDNVPIALKNIRSNWDLSALRAISVVTALQTNYGVDPKRLTAGGRGEYNPIADNSTEAGKMQNRRTQIIITPKLDQFMDLIGKAPEKAAETK
ncbi:OmpA/MotB family protein [Mucilaginibacter myungsuensis]|uniref:OmpA family protein n=1 Tax=Mucilaginibacter myungsuensis TaxID=649104 RepID=A0A929PU46_9SPHI|nr:OmpA family protein [Mucilaginibacter myungsuensis]MBE9660363.1 OmpA family protein [Mucilaginibacter myungsuensis]MDN3600405.1 OmpA family protein [Mucilaginibacter myungsuensis]